MTKLLFDLESVLQQLIVEHRKLLRQVASQQNAMKTFALDEMDVCANQQEASRLRVGSLESRRRSIIAEIAKQNRLAGDVSLSRLATLFPQRADSLMKLRADLKMVVMEIQSRTHVAGKLAGAVLGHLNTVVRLLAGAVERAGIYTKQGVPQVSTRIGVMEAVG
jgi:hypothetical protein